MIRFPENWKTPGFLKTCPICERPLFKRLQTVKPRDITIFATHLYQVHDIPLTALP
jgi:hypothetical protein